MPTTGKPWPLSKPPPTGQIDAAWRYHHGFVANGLNKPSQVQANRILSLLTATVGPVIGRLTERELDELDRLLAVVIGLA